VRLAVLAALGGGKLPRHWFDALSEHPEEVEGAEYRTNSDRSEAAFLARQRR
jgi:hypothetical protein